MFGGSIDWSATGDMLSGLGTVLGAFAVFVAAFIGKAAVADYRAQKLAGNEIDYAEKILTVAYRLNDAISTIRNPMSFAEELAESEADLNSRQVLDGSTDAERRRLVQANVYFIRAKRYDDLFREAYELMPIAKAYFGDEAHECIRRLIHARHSIRVYAQAYARNDGAEDKDFTKKVHAAIWEGYGEAIDSRDEISESVTGSIETLEARLIPIIRPGKAKTSLATQAAPKPTAAKPKAAKPAAEAASK